MRRLSGLFEVRGRRYVGRHRFTTPTRFVGMVVVRPDRAGSGVGTGT